MRNFTARVILFSFFITFLFPYQGECQLSAGGEPPSVLLNLPENVEGKITLTPPDLTAALQEDQKFPSPYRCGLVLPADVSPDYSGAWTTLPEGLRIWRATISAPGALALSAYFDRFQIPEGGKLFIYNSDKSQVIGAFTALNNSETGVFATELIEGDEMTFEYVQPTGSDQVPLLHLNEISFAYRGVNFFNRTVDSPGSAGNCEVNVNCPEGVNWQNQKKGVVCIHVKRNGGTYWCSGSLINTTKVDNTPYILTANHCGFNSTEKELEQWVFYFNYEAPECPNPAIYPKITALVGATLKAHSGNQQAVGSDFYLIKLISSIPDSLHVYYNGWSRSEDNPSPSGVGIHHPGGDLKKISTYSHQLESTTWNANPGYTHWKVTWSQTVSGHGVTEGGSSGSPLFDNKGRIVGTLSGGESNCDSSKLNLPDYYGKFAWAWESDGNDSTSRLKDWLDPGSTNAFILDGSYIAGANPIIPPLQSVFPNPFKKYLTISMPQHHNGLIHVTVYDIPGRMLFSGDNQLGDNGSVEINLEFLPQGLYILRAESQTSTINRKIIRE